MQGGRSFNVIPITVFFFADFDDMSCEMIFGKEPPASIDDPALKQPCYKLCIYLNTSLLLSFFIIPFTSLPVSGEVKYIKKTHRAG